MCTPTCRGDKTNQTRWTHPTPWHLIRFDLFFFKKSKWPELDSRPQKNLMLDDPKSDPIRPDPTRPMIWESFSVKLTRSDPTRPVRLPPIETAKRQNLTLAQPEMIRPKPEKKPILDDPKPDPIQPVTQQSFSVKITELDPFDCHLYPHDRKYIVWKVITWEYAHWSYAHY